MEGSNLSLGGNMIPGVPYGGVLDLQESLHVHHQQQQHPHTLHQQQHSHPHQGSSSMIHPPIHDVFPLTVGNMHECDQTINLVDFNKGEKVKNSTSDEDDEPSLNEDGNDGKGKKGAPWQRMKWTDSIVRLLITVVSYIGEDAAAASDCGNGGRRKFAVLQKKGKWKSVSKVMAERGCFVSPQQCEDKFNDLNKRYKRLTDVLGMGTSCKVVANPALLDMMDLSEKAKEDVRKILSSKHLFYEEMCSYHNGNRLHLPTDPALLRSLQLALGSRDDHETHETKRHPQDDVDEEDHDAETDDCDDESEENHVLNGDNRGTFGVPGSFAKRIKHGQDHEDLNFGNPSSSQDCNKRCQSHAQIVLADMNQVFPEGSKGPWLEKQWVQSHLLQLEEQKFQIQEQMLDLEKRRLKWQKFSRKKDRELDKMRMENERMKLENERMALDLKHKELQNDHN